MYINVEIVKTLIVERLSGPEGWATLTAEWESLDEQIFPRSPFTSPLWIGLWWKHFRRRNPLFRDEFFCHIVRDAHGRLVAIAPLMRTYCPGLGRPRIRMVQFFGTDPSITELRGVICRPKDQEKVIKALTEHFLRHRGEWDVFRWNGLHHDPSAYNSPATCCEFLARHDLPAYIIELPGRWDELRARVSANMRKNLRKPYEFLERDGRNFRLRIVERPDDVQAAIDRFLSLHAARSKVADMINHPNKFGRSRNRAFLVDYLRQTAERGHLRIFELEIDGVVIASRLAFLLGPDLYLYFAGYDPSWRKYSVMTILVCEMIKWAIAHGLQRVNLSTGNDQSKLRWKPIEICFHDAVQVSPSRRGRLLFPAFRAYEGLSHFREECGRRSHSVHDHDPSRL
jgi:CelD/BcsL family acetyltransferase involved in cellulose biosynthesis